MQGLSDAVCGVTTDTAYAEEFVRPIVASYETDGSVFLLWERKAAYTAADGSKHKEDICGVTYVKKEASGKASVIATFRQPSPVRACLLRSLLCVCLQQRRGSSTDTASSVCAASVIAFPQRRTGALALCDHILAL